MAFKMEQLIGIGTLLIIIGFIAIFIGTLNASKESSSKAKIAVGGFIGPIPFGFGNDKNLVWFVTALSFIMIILWLIIGFSKHHP